MVDPNIAPDELPRVSKNRTPDTACDKEQMAKFPQNYEAMIAQAETNILPEDIPRKYYPPEGKPHTYKNDY